MSERFTTPDLWLAACFLSEAGAELEDIVVSKNGRTTINFAFRGENLTEIAREYSRGQAQANVTELRNKLNFLRDIIFQSTKKRR